jgi:hypothetical protein
LLTDGSGIDLEMMCSRRLKVAVFGNIDAIFRPKLPFEDLKGYETKTHIFVMKKQANASDKHNDHTLIIY